MRSTFELDCALRSRAQPLSIACYPTPPHSSSSLRLSLPPTTCQWPQRPFGLEIKSMHTAQPAIILNGLFRLIHAASRRHLQLSGYRHIRLQSIPDACLMTARSDLTFFRPAYSNSTQTCRAWRLRYELAAARYTAVSDIQEKPHGVDDNKRL